MLKTVPSMFIYYTFNENRLGVFFKNIFQNHFSKQNNVNYSLLDVCKCTALRCYTQHQQMRYTKNNT